MPNYDDEYERRQRLLTESVETGRVTERDANAIKELCDAFPEDTLTVTRKTWPDAIGTRTNAFANGTAATHPGRSAFSNSSHMPAVIGVLSTNSATETSVDTI